MRRLPVCFLFISFWMRVNYCAAQEQQGAAIPWTTYEAEQMHTNGIVLKAAYTPFRVETESSGQQAVSLTARGQFVEFTAKARANSIVIRYSLPDSKSGSGLEGFLGILINGKAVQRCKLSSRYTWLYGKYPFTNDPSAGSPRHFYDEIRIKELTVKKGDVIRLVWEGDRNAAADYCIIDLADLEQIPAALEAPANTLLITDKRFRDGDSGADYTTAFRKCIAVAAETGQTVWIPAGKFIISGDIRLPAHISIQGAGMWYTELLGDTAKYAAADHRIRLIGDGDSIHLSDFSIEGALNYRSDKEPNDGIVGAFGTGSVISRIWVEHTKVGMWVENSKHLTITGCRMRNTIADGINFCVGMAYSTIDNCAARGTGDDGFAIWPAVFSKQVNTPGHNLITHCTAQLPFLANGAAIYGGESNAITYCTFSDISQGSAVLISTTFPTENKARGVNNNFTGTTLVKACTIKTSGGFDHEWGWRGAIEICLDKRSVTGLTIEEVKIEQGLSNAISVVAKDAAGQVGMLENALLENVAVKGYSKAVAGRYALFIDAKARGSLLIRSSVIPDKQNNAEGFVITR